MPNPFAAARRCTIESACAKLESGPGVETVRQYLNEQLTPEHLPELETSLNEALVSQVPERLWRKDQDIAIGLHDQPYYGKTSQEEGLHLRWLYTQVPRRGHRRLDAKRFTLARFVRFIVSAVERQYGCAHEMIAPAVPIP